MPIFAHAATKEQAVKAGFVYNVTKYVVWPSRVSNEEHFNLCVYGDADLGGSLKSLQNKLVLNKPIVLRRWVKSNNLEACHMVFIATNSTDDVSDLLQKISHLPVLTISDSPNFIDNGGMVGLVRNGTRVGFEVNLKAVRAAKLNMSAQLLKLAKSVRGVE
jgi:hypothetical protein